ncbi:MAG: D-arabinono-1,4-lactone oxidase [Actinomycetota bacterium]
MATRREVTNWSKLQRFQPREIHHPRTEEELAALVQRAGREGRRVKVMGAGHSFTAIAVTPDIHVRIDALDSLHAVNPNTGLVTVGAGISLRALNQVLDGHGLALTNMGDIDRQSIAGAISTGTHGTGLAFGGIATQVRALRLLTPDGESIDVGGEQDAELFACARVGLGALGIITRVTLQAVPSFRIAAHEFSEPLDATLDAWADRIANNDHVEFYCMPGGRNAAVKINNRTDEPASPLSRRTYIADKLLGENVGFGVINRVARRAPKLAPTVAKLLNNTSVERTYTDTSYRVFTTPRWVHFYESEWSVPLDALPDVLADVNRFARTIGKPITFPIEVRCAAADNIPLSTANGENRGYIAAHVFWGTPYDEYFAGFWSIVRHAGGRPHWGKMHAETAETLAPLYPDWERFQSVRRKADPDGVFTNSYLERVLGPIN